MARRDISKRSDILPAQPIPAPTVAGIVADFLKRRSRNTRAAYRSDLEDFARFVGVGSPVAVVRGLFEAGAGPANVQVQRYRDSLVEKGMAPATVNRRLAAIRSMVKAGRLAGLINWTVEVEGERAEAYRDTAGPGEETFRAMLAVAGPRDRAILRLLHDLALRRGELTALDLDDWDPKKRTLKVTPKGKRRPDVLKVPLPTNRALLEWLGVRSPAPGPLFLSGRPGYASHRLTPDGVHLVVGRLGRAVGVQRVTPHGLRHTAISEVLRLMGGNMAAAQAFARHRNPQTTMVYLDNLNGLAGEAAEKLAESVNGAQRE